jgi:hypothetical protein
MFRIESLVETVSDVVPEAVEVIELAISRNFRSSTEPELLV